MPVVPYYHGHSARVWTAAMTGHGLAWATAPESPAVAAPAEAASPVSPRPAAPTAQRTTQEHPGSRAIGVASTSAWSTWASLWFVPHAPS